MQQGGAAGTLSAKSIYLSTFALCGFANFASIGILFASRVHGRAARAAADAVAGR